MQLLRGDVFFAIAATKANVKSTLPILIPSLLRSGIPMHAIHVFIGGCSCFRVVQRDNINVYEADHNSFDFTPLISIVEHNVYSPRYWFLLHDTCKVGPNFHKLVCGFKGSPLKIALKKSPSMNMGLYSDEFLLGNKEAVLSLKNTDFSAESLAYWKRWGVENEDFLLWRLGGEPEVYPNGNMWFVYDTLNWYGSNIERRTEYYIGLDLYKNKANWGQQPDFKRIL